MINQSKLVTNNQLAILQLIDIPSIISYTYICETFSQDFFKIRVHIFFPVGVSFSSLYLGGFKTKNHFFTALESHIKFGIYLGYTKISTHMYPSSRLKEKHASK